MTLTCDRCSRQFVIPDQPVPGRVYRVPCRCGANVVFEAGSTGRARSAQPAAGRWTPPPLPPATRAGPQLRAPALGAAAAGGVAAQMTGAVGRMTPGALAAWTAALPGPDAAGDAPAEPTSQRDIDALPGLDPDPEEGIEHSVLGWISAETARDRAFAVGFASGSGASVLAVVAAAWLGIAAARVPLARGSPSPVRLPVVHEVSAQAGHAEQASPSPLANAIALAAPTSATPPAAPPPSAPLARASNKPPLDARAAGHRQLARPGARADDAEDEERGADHAEPVVEARSPTEAQPAAEAGESSDAEPLAARSGPAAAEEPAGSVETRSAAVEVAQPRVAAEEATPASERLAATAQAPATLAAAPLPAPPQAPDSQAADASSGADPLAAKF